ncbi:MAG: P1 family peptidase [Thermomicrobiales bacterium]|nr:P1 family peptidase [Thermomicrobiales bacterium]
MTQKPRLRDLGITIGTLPTGPLNAITDVAGVRVGLTTIIDGDGALEVGKGPVRTGVTAIHPHEGSTFLEQVPAAIDVLNGAGEMTGRTIVEEFGILSSPILITNTLSVGAVHQATVEWMTEQHPEIGPREWVAPVIAETYDGVLNDIAGQHVKAEHVRAALDSATGGPVPEGNTGGGTGMLLFGFKGGTGTSSRTVEVEGTSYTVGVLVQGNFGSLPQLLVDGVPVGREFAATVEQPGLWQGQPPSRDGSIIVIIGTDAPLSERQLGRLCRRAMLGLGRVGSTAGHGSGDILLAFSNARENRVPRWPSGPLLTSTRLADEWIGPAFAATVDATAEAVLNAMIAAETMTGRDNITAHALPHDTLQEIMRKYGR